MEIYFDNASSTKLLENMEDEIIKIYQMYGNPSSIHKLGRESKNQLEYYRREIAKTLNIDYRDLIFTSGATESNNLIIKGIALKKEKGHIITTKIEHPSVLRVCEYLETKGFNITYLDVNEKGSILIEDLEKAIREDTFLVSIMAVNNETGVKQPLKEIANILKNKKIYFHSDIVQLFLKEDIELSSFNLDAFSISFHKIHGPKGVGLAYLKNSVEFEKTFFGGHHERNRRAGTENLTSIILASKIYLIMKKNLTRDLMYIKKLNEYLVSKLNILKDKIKINGENRINNILNIQIKGQNIDYLLPLLDLNEIYLSAGSACQSGALNPSNVLLNMGLSEKEAKSSIRISLSIYNTIEEIDKFINILTKIIT